MNADVLLENPHVIPPGFTQLRGGGDHGDARVPTTGHFHEAAQDRLVAEFFLRTADRDAFVRGVKESTISLEEAESWMRVIGEARLVLAARLGITKDGWEDEADPTQSPEMALLGYLGYLQDSLVSIL